MRTLLPVVIWSSLFAVALVADTNRGVELYNQGKYAEAQSELSKAVAAAPDDARAYRYLGLSLVEQHKASEAEAPLKKADELASNGDTKLALARMYVEEKQLDKAEALVNEADGSEKEYVRGLIQFFRNQNKEAAASLENYLKDNPDQPYAHYYAGLAYSGAKRPDKMLTHFELFLKLKPDAPEARKVRAVMSTGR